MTFTDAAGLPCAGCKLYTYSAGTTTPLATYVDSAGVSQNPNPIILDASGGPQTPSGSTGGIWLGRNSYKFILKTATGTTIWTADNVNAASLFPCGPQKTIQIANTAVNGLNCDSNITIDPINHTLNVGVMSTNHVTIGALGTPTSWFFDTTSPATACASIGCGTSAGTVTSVSVATANGVSATVANPTTTPALTFTLGAITPSSLAVAGGTALSDNQGNGTKIQHSTGSTVAGHGAEFDANGNVVDAGSVYPVGTARTCNSNGCYQIDGDGTIRQWGTVGGCITPDNASCSVSVAFPTAFTTSSDLTVTTSVANWTNCLANPNSVTTTGFSMSFASLIFVGGAGNHCPGTQTGEWHATGH